MAKKHNGEEDGKKKSNSGTRGLLDGFRNPKSEDLSTHLASIANLKSVVGLICFGTSFVDATAKAMSFGEAGNVAYAFGMLDPEARKARRIFATVGAFGPYLQANGAVQGQGDVDPATVLQLRMQEYKLSTGGQPGIGVRVINVRNRLGFFDTTSIPQRFGGFGTYVRYFRQQHTWICKHPERHSKFPQSGWQCWLSCSDSG